MSLLVGVSNQNGEDKVERHTCFELLCKPKIDQLKMTFSIDEDVLWLHVAVGYAKMVMEILEDQDNFSSVESSRWFVEALSSAQVGEDLSARAVVELWKLAWPTVR